MKDVKDLGAELDRLRREAGITRKELARRAGVSHATVGYILSGKHIPRLATLETLAAVLPLDLAAWGPAVEAYHLAARRRAQRLGAEANRARHYCKRDKPKPRAAAPSLDQVPRAAAPSLDQVPRAAAPSLSQVAQLARAAGMTYGAYVSAHSPGEIREAMKGKDVYMR